MYYNILIRQKEKDFKMLKVTTKENLLKCLKNLLNYEFSKDHNLKIITNEYITFKHFIFNILENEKTIKKIVIIKSKNKYYFEKYNKN